MRLSEAAEIIKEMRAGKRVNSQYFAAIYQDLTGNKFKGIGDASYLKKCLEEMEEVIQKKTLHQPKEEKIVDVIEQPIKENGRKRKK